MSVETTVKTFTEIDDELKRISEEIKSMKANKVSLENDISSHMDRNELDEMDCSDNTKVKKYTKKSVSNVFKKPNVEECSLLLFGKERTEALIKMIEEKKEVRESVGIKRMATKRQKKTQA